VAQRDAFHKIRNFAPELVAANEGVDLASDVNDLDSLFDRVRREYHADVRETHRLRLAKALQSLAEVEAYISQRSTPSQGRLSNREMREFEINKIRDVAPELFLDVNDIDPWHAIQRLITTTVE
jgi:hypothetical protein